MSEIIQTNLDDDVIIIKEWLQKQLHLPQNIDEHLLKRFILSCKGSLEKTKQIIDLCYTIRSQAPEIFANRDVKNPDIQHIMSLGELLPLPKRTSENYKLLLFRISEKNVDNFLFSDVLKVVLMLADVRLVSEKDIADGEIPIFDMAKISLQHLSKVNLPALRKYMLYTQEAHPVRLKAIHVINTPPFLDKVLMLVRPFIHSRVAPLLHFHTDVESLSKYIPTKLLPEEYGGSAGKLNDIKAEWYKKLEEHRDYLLDETRWKVDESKRVTKNKYTSDLIDTQGSFRSLNID